MRLLKSFHKPSYHSCKLSRRCALLQFQQRTKIVGLYILRVLLFLLVKLSGAAHEQCENFTRTEHTVPELIPVLDGQQAGDRSQARGYLLSRRASPPIGRYQIILYSAQRFRLCAPHFGVGQKLCFSDELSSLSYYLCACRHCAESSAVIARPTVFKTGAVMGVLPMFVSFSRVWG